MDGYGIPGELVIIEPHWNLKYHSPSPTLSSRRNNRTTLESKVTQSVKVVYFTPVIIEPHWNLKIKFHDAGRKKLIVIIEPHWNLKLHNLLENPRQNCVIIEPHWNLKYFSDSFLFAPPKSNNRTTLESKGNKPGMRILGSSSNNRTTLESKVYREKREGRRKE